MLQNSASSYQAEEYNPLAPPSSIVFRSILRLKCPFSYVDGITSQNPKLTCSPSRSGLRSQCRFEDRVLNGHIHTGVMPISDSRKSKNAGAWWMGISTSWITDSVPPESGMSL